MLLYNACNSIFKWAEWAIILEFTGRYKLEYSGKLPQKKRDLFNFRKRTALARVAIRKYFLIYIKLHIKIMLGSEKNI